MSSYEVKGMKSVMKTELANVKSACSPSGGILKILTGLTMIGGILILALGAAFLEKKLGAAWTPGALVAIGLFVLIFSCLGFWAAMMKNRAALCCFSLFIGAFTIFEFATAIACFALASRLDDWISDDYVAKFYNGDKSTVKALAETHMKMLGGFAIFLVLLQIVTIATALLYRKALKDGEYENMRSYI
mmetsp:Transcript_24815/g.42776  ORF Transcript_24815/g.42776 Transcript_24815/m.42776 type:complete len:189 (+) Transcript_24815:87-653(+)|eukprot:CAMPEP_0196651990 /NCGR_PEP_ID=MMETSP1086-20130531/1182_1 /TAXON_ID=77921 /ORGANISM="Cyanoptyche  gloeocystis , Strain SAG4.97" /LENGTH=188 /DNA_ID=CAMNT_0041982315 /DNA_START=60 /DNA_END=626 /DNA_ORIENTATION=+